MTSSMISKSFAGVTNKLINQRDLKQILEADIRSFSKRHHGRTYGSFLLGLSVTLFACY